MQRPRLVCCLALTACLALTPTAGAQPPTEFNLASIEAQLKAVNSSLQQLVALLTLQVDNQRAELAIQRLDIARREITVLERELHQARTTRDQWANDQASLAGQRDAMEANLDVEDADADQRERLRSHFEVQSQAMESNLWRLDQRILDLEGELARGREDLSTWEELVAEALR